MCADRGRWLSPSAGVYGWSVLPTMANGHDARLLELVEELGGDRVRGLFRELLQKALQDLIDTSSPRLRTR